MEGHLKLRLQSLKQTGRIDIQLMKSKNLIDNIWTAEDGRPPPTAKVS